MIEEDGGVFCAGLQHDRCAVFSFKLNRFEEGVCG
jgi:hypothetical protein